MRRSDTLHEIPALPPPGAGLPSERHIRSLDLACRQCAYPLECLEQNRHSGTWLGSFLCANCRSEYFYAYRWGRLVRKT